MKTGMIRNCKVCNKEFYISKSQMKSRIGIYCSYGCMHTGRKTGVFRMCFECGNQFYVKKNISMRDKEGKYCSMSCFRKNKSLQGEKECLFCKKKYSRPNYCRGKNWKDKKFCSNQCASGNRKGKKFTLEHKIKISKALMGHIVTKEARNKISAYSKLRIPWNKDKRNPQQSGAKSYFWKGGISKINKSEREFLMNTFEYKQWRKTVFNRDNYTCVLCGDNRGGNLEADHIKSWKEYPELRFNINNGRTLCHDCHTKTDTYGYRKKIINATI